MQLCWGVLAFLQLAWCYSESTRSDKTCLISGMRV